MRLLMLTLASALSLTSLAAAQSNTHPDQQRTDRLLVQHPSTPAEREVGRPEQQAPDDAHGVCYTMRSYIFERRGTEAPRLVGMVTCTPSSQRQFKRAKPAPKPNLVPAD
jgi:hypothetical protein